MKYTACQMTDNGIFLARPLLF